MTTEVSSVVLGKGCQTQVMEPDSLFNMLLIQSTFDAGLLYIVYYLWHRFDIGPRSGR